MLICCNVAITLSRSGSGKQSWVSKATLGWSYSLQVCDGKKVKSDKREQVGNLWQGGITKHCAAIKKSKIKLYVPKVSPQRVLRKKKSRAMTQHCLCIKTFDSFGSMFMGESVQKNMWKNTNHIIMVRSLEKRLTLGIISQGELFLL